MTHALFLGLLALCAAGFLLSRRPRVWRMDALFAAVFLALAAHQAWWQLHGGGSIAFQRFRQRYDPRPGIRLGDKRGRLLDRNGQVLAQGLSGQSWGHDAPLGAAGLHVVGYASRSCGLSGLERVYDARLCGYALPESPADFLRRSPPQDVRTTLDATLQKAAYDALGGQKGAVVALDPRTGEVLALVSSPACPDDEASLLHALSRKADAPLFNRATQGLYPPGSVFKLFTAALALDCRRAGAYVCSPGGWIPAPGTKPIRDTHPQRGEDPIPLETAFAQSSNIWFAKAARACGFPAFQAAAKRCRLDSGFTLARCGERTYGCVAGHFPDMTPTPARTVYLGFGQGELRLTPLHVAALTAAMAHDGVLAAPHLEKGAPAETLRFWPAATARRVRGLMRASVLRGTSRGIDLPGLAVCGKTGTAENSGRDHAWFTCFAPEEQPRIVVTVLVEHGGFGAQAALPVARNVLQAWQSLPR